MRTTKTILKKVDEWRNIPMMVTGIYRLFTYLPYEEIPDEYRSFFPEEAKEEWDKDLNEYGKKDMKMDMSAEIRALLQTLSKRNITNALGIVPMLLADVYMYGTGIGPFQGKLAKIVKNYQENLSLERNLAEQLAIYEVVELIREISSKLKLSLSYDIDIVLKQLLDKYEADLKHTAITMAQQQARAMDSKDKPNIDYDKIIEEAEAYEESMKKEKESIVENE